MRITFSTGIQTVELDVNERQSIKYYVAELKKQLNLSGDYYFFGTRGELIDQSSALGFAVRDEDTVRIKKRFNYTIRWRNEEVGINDYTNMRVSSLIRKCVRKLQLTDIAPLKYVLECSDGRILDNNSYIPFSGILGTLTLRCLNNDTAIKKRTGERAVKQYYDYQDVDKHSTYSTDSDSQVSASSKNTRNGSSKRRRHHKAKRKRQNDTQQERMGGSLSSVTKRAKETSIFDATELNELPILESFPNTEHKTDFGISRDISEIVEFPLPEENWTYKQPDSSEDNLIETDMKEENWTYKTDVHIDDVTLPNSERIGFKQEVAISQSQDKDIITVKILNSGDEDIQQFSIGSSIKDVITSIYGAELVEDIVLTVFSRRVILPLTQTLTHDYVLQVHSADEIQTVTVIKGECNTNVIYTDDLTPNDIIKEIGDEDRDQLYILNNPIPLCKERSLKDQNVIIPCSLELKSVDKPVDKSVVIHYPIKSIIEEFPYDSNRTIKEYYDDFRKKNRLPLFDKLFCVCLHDTNKAIELDTKVGDLTTTSYDIRKRKDIVGVEKQEIVESEETDKIGGLVVVDSLSECNPINDISIRLTMLDKTETFVIHQSEYQQRFRDITLHLDKYSNEQGDLILMDNSGMQITVTDLAKKTGNVIEVHALKKSQITIPTWGFIKAEFDTSNKLFKTYWRITQYSTVQMKKILGDIKFSNLSECTISDAYDCAIVEFCKPECRSSFIQDCVSYKCLIMPYRIFTDARINEFMDFIKQRMHISVLKFDINKRENQSRIKTIEFYSRKAISVCKYSIMINGREVSRAKPNVLQIVQKMVDNLKDIELSDFDVDTKFVKNDNKERSYGRDESVLIYDTKRSKYASDTFDALSIQYMRNKGKRATEDTYCSLQSALTDGCNSLHLGEHIKFKGRPHLKKEDTEFILPLISQSKSHNIVPDAVYFHCLSGVKGATIGILTPENKVVNVYCQSNILIFHSSTYSIKVIKAYRSDKVEWKYIISNAYRKVDSLHEDLPFVKKTDQTKIRDSVVEDVIKYNIPTVIEGVTSSGKTFTVEQYCMRAQLPLVRYNFSPSSTTEELLGDVVITNNETERIRFQDGAFTDAFIHGKVLLMDEMSLAPPSVIQSVLSYLFGRKILYEGKERSEEREMHRDFRIIATQNPAGSSYKRSNLSSSIRDCFRFITHDSSKPKFFPRIDGKERLEIISALFDNESIGKQVSDVHGNAEKRTRRSTLDIDKGKDYTLRDCSRTKWLLRVYKDIKGIRESDALKRALQVAYNVSIKAAPIIKHRITFGKAPLDRRCWTDVYDRIYAGLKAGCHILLIGESEYVARKYCRAIMEILNKDGTSSEVIHCSSTSSTEGIIGSYTLQKENGDPVPLFCPSPLLQAIENGGVCILQSMHAMRSNVIERLNSVLELSPADGHKHAVRFDEHREKPVFYMSPEFRVIATTSMKGLLAFSPALRNRFLEVYVYSEDENFYEMKPDYKEEYHGIENEEIEQYIDNKNDCYKRQVFHRMVSFAVNMTHYKVDNTIADMVTEEDLINELRSVGNQIEVFSKLFYSICRSKASALCGPRMSGKTYGVHKLLSQLDVEKYQFFSVSGETEFSTLMGSTDIKGDFHAGRLLQAVERGELVIFDNAENMSVELLEMLDIVLDPFTDEFNYPANEVHMIHPSFRALFIFTTRRENAIVSLPAYFEIHYLKAISNDNAKSMMTSDICKKLCDHVSTGEIPLSEVFTLDKICYDVSHPLWRVAALFADRADRKALLEKILDDWKKILPMMRADSRKKLEDELNQAYVIMSTPSATARHVDVNKSSLQRGALEVTVPISCNKLDQVDSSVLTAIFNASLSNYKRIRLPILLVGDSDITLEVSRLMFPTALRMELSRSMEMSHTFGEVSVCRKEDIQYILRQTSESEVGGSPMESYREYLKGELDELEDSESLLMMRPGPILRAIMSNNSLVLNNVNLLNDRLLPRLYALLLNLDSDNFSLFEDYVQMNRHVVGNRVNVILTCESHDVSRVEKHDQFIQVFCQPFSKLEKEKYAFYNREIYPLHILRKSSLLVNEFKSPEKVIPFYLTYLQSDSSSRLDLIRRNAEVNDEELNAFLRSSNKDDAMIENVKSLSFLFSNDVITWIEKSLNSKHHLLPTKTTVQLLASIVLADISHIPLILEGDPGVGKTVAAENYFTEHDLEFKRINFSNSITVDSLFGCYTLVNGSLQFKNGSITELLVKGTCSKKRIALLLDEVNLAPCDVLEVILSLLRCYTLHEQFQIPGSDLIDIPKDMVIICCMNPAAMSANRSTLPRQFYKYCIYHRDLKYTLNELFITARYILSNVVDYSNSSMEDQILDLFAYSFKSYQRTSIPFSLRDVLKVDQILSSGSDLNLTAALWLVFACRYDEAERKEIEKILKQQDQLNVEIVKEDDCCIVRGYWDIMTTSMYSDSFHEWCFTSTERITLFKLSLALQSKRAVLLYGESPSGKSYTISNLALMWNKRCMSVFLNHGSSPDIFIGRNTLGVDDNGNETIAFRKGPLLEAMENGDWIVIEDIHLANNDVMESLNSLCEENPTLKVLAGNEEITYSSNPKGNEIRINPSFRIFFTISDNTLKHFTGPFLSRCVIVYCDPISTQANVQEICQINESSHDPSEFGPDEAKSFRRCIRVINSKEDNGFLYEFGYKPNSNSVVSILDIPKTIDYELSQFLDNASKMSEEMKMNDIIRIMERICNSTRSAFVIEDTIQLLVGCLQYFEKHFIYYVLDACISILNGKDLKNGKVKKQECKEASILYRWCAFKFIDPKMKGRYDMNQWKFNPDMQLNELFSISMQNEYQLLELYYICNRENELRTFMQEEVLFELACHTFHYIDSSDRSDKSDELIRTIYDIRMYFSDTKKKLSKKVTATICLDVDTHIQKVEELISMMPSELRKAKCLEQIINLMKTMREELLSRINYDDDDDESRKNNYHLALVRCEGNGELRRNMEEAFDSKQISSETFSALNFNFIESHYTIWKYESSKNMMLVKTSHFLYKLRAFKNYPFILSEYSDVLKKLELNVVDILRGFENGYNLIPKLEILLNVLLKKEMEDLDWDSLIRDYCDYPFLTHVEVSQEEFEEAVKDLFEMGWYASYRGVHKISSFKEIVDHLNNKLLCYAPVPHIHLQMPKLLKAIDTGEGLQSCRYQWISMVSPWWKCDMSDDVEDGVIISCDVLRNEKMLLSASSNDPAYEMVWSNDCKLSVEEKMSVICPRKSTLLGRVVKDMLNNNELKEAAAKCLSSAISIPDLVERVKLHMKRSFEGKESDLQEHLNAFCDEQAQIERDQDNYKNELLSLRETIMNKYAAIAAKRTEEAGYTPEYGRKNDNTIKMLCYMRAVNNLIKEPIDFYQSNYSLKDLLSKYLKDNYVAFSFQLVRCKKLMSRMRIELLPPEGLGQYLIRDSFSVDVCNAEQRIMDGDDVYLVLPLAPFKWKIQIHDVCDADYSLKYYQFKSSSLKKKKQDDGLILTKLCLRVMKDTFLHDGGIYKLDNVSIPTLCKYANKLQGGSSFYISSLYVTDNDTFIFQSTDMRYIRCNEITSSSDIIPYSDVQTEIIKTEWTIKDYIFVEDEMSKMTAIDNKASEDVSEFNRKLSQYEAMMKNSKKSDIDTVTNEIEEVKKKVLSVENYFFPCVTGDNHYMMTNESDAVYDVIVVYSKNNQLLLCRPEGGIFKLPIHYLERHDNRIEIPIIVTSDTIHVSMTSEGCEIQIEDYICHLEVNDINPGINRIIVTVHMEDEKNSCEEELIIEFEQKYLPNHITTDKVCCISKDAPNKLITTEYPVSVQVNSEEVRICDESSYELMQNPKILLIKTLGDGEKGRWFEYDENGCLSLFKDDIMTPNKIIIDIEDDEDSNLIQNITSHDVATFTNVLYVLPFQVLSMCSDEKKRVYSILHEYDSDKLLPSIKDAIERVIQIMDSSKSVLRWHEVDKFITNQESVAVNQELGSMEVQQPVVMEKALEQTKSKRTWVKGRINQRTIKEISQRVQALVQQNEDSVYSEEGTRKEVQSSMPVSDTNYKSVNYKGFLDVMNSKSMDDLFSTVYQRRLVTKYVKPMSVEESISVIDYIEKRSRIKIEMINCLTSSAVKILLKYYSKKAYGKPFSVLNIIIDTNCSFRRKKLRMRTIVSSILIVILKELGIHFNLYVFCGRYKGAFIPIEDQSVHKIISFLFDIEEVVKLPSTPLDLLTVKGRFDKNDSSVIISDGFSEQLMSQDDSVRNIIKSYKHLHLILIRGVYREALSKRHSEQQMKALKSNFNGNIITIQDMRNLYTDWIAQLLFDENAEDMNSKSTVIPSLGFAHELRDMLASSFDVSESAVFINTISSSRNVKMVDILDENLNECPKACNDSTVLRELSSVILPDNLFDALSISLFVPNKSTAYIPSTSGTSIHVAKYIKYLVSKTGDGKFFKKLGSEKVRSYNASVVIDCSSIAFSETNRIHSLITVFSIVRNLSNLELPCVDIWVARNEIIRVATGLSSMDIWESNVVASLYQSLMIPTRNTCLPDCIRYAACTCGARSFQSVMIVLTNGVLCNGSREEIKTIVNGIEMTYLGIGIGSYLCGFEDLFPTMIWNSNPIRLSDTIANMSNPLPNEFKNAVPRKRIDGMILNGTFGKSFTEMVEKICNIPSIYEVTLSSVRFDDQTDGPDAVKKISDINSSKYDLGVDGAFGDYSILFIILYLCRGEKDERGRIIDPDITEDILQSGKVVNGEQFSPILKLGDAVVDGKPIGKGFKIKYAYDYKSAINRLMSGRYRMTFITCSPGDGIMAKKCDDDVDQYADAFVSCVHEFHQRGGGVFWFLENYPFTYEADLYFKKYYGFEAIGDKDKQIKGGRVMERVKSDVPTPGHFITVGGEATDFHKLSKLDFGITRIFEGNTLCKMNESKLEGIGFRHFAKEHEGNASIMVRESEDGSQQGRMIIDTAASKLFLEFTSDGTARWISNAAVWLCNTEEFEESRFQDKSATPGIKMDGVTLPNKSPMNKRITKSKQVNFCMTILIDTTGSMTPYINACKNNIIYILNKLQLIQQQYHLPPGGIVGQVVQYKDYADEMIGERAEYITNDFNLLRRKLDTFIAHGGASGASEFCWCEDIQGGLIRALREMKKPPYNEYNHLILIVGDYPNHHIGIDCFCNENKQLGISFDTVWRMIYRDIRRFKNIRVMFMPVGEAKISLTKDTMQQSLGNQIVDSANASTESNFVEIITNTAVTEYKRFIGIS